MAKPTDRAPSHDDRPDWYIDPEPSAGVVYLGRRLSPRAVQLWQEEVAGVGGHPYPVEDLANDHAALSELHRAGLVRLSKDDAGRWFYEPVRHFLLPVSLDDVTEDGLLVFDVHGAGRSSVVHEWAEVVPVLDCHVTRDYAGSQVRPEDTMRAFNQRLAVGEELPTLPGDPETGVLAKQYGRSAPILQVG